MFDDNEISRQVGRYFDAAEAYLNISIKSPYTSTFDEAVSDIRVSEVAAYLSSALWGRHLINAGIVPSAITGVGVGALAAIAIAGGYSVGAGLALVCKRAQTMFELIGDSDTSNALCIGLEGPRVAEILGQISGVWVASYQNDTVQVIAGAQVAIDYARGLLLDAGARKVQSIPFHYPIGTPMMLSADQELSGYIKQMTFSQPMSPLFSAYSQKFIVSSDDFIEELSHSLSRPAHLSATIRSLEPSAQGPIVEVGPGGQLCGIIQRDVQRACYAVSIEGLAGIFTRLNSEMQDVSNDENTNE